jgi:hypothetical protein
MSFDLSKVYTCVNADELEKGDKVLVGNSLRELKNKYYFTSTLLYSDYIFTIEEIMYESCEKRFMIEEEDFDGNSLFSLAYLIERKK